METDNVSITSAEWSVVQPASVLSGCLCASESVYGLTVEVIMEHLSTLALIVMVLGLRKASNLGGPESAGR